MWIAYVASDIGVNISLGEKTKALENFSYQKKTKEKMKPVWVTFG